MSLRTTRAAAAAIAGALRPAGAAATAAGAVLTASPARAAVACEVDHAVNAARPALRPRPL